ncbi:MAG: helix-turn-helix domain-containing protein [Planctomycetota bacterium]|jgi:transcriptional regulator with XRE-family HTH domain
MSVSQAEIAAHLGLARSTVTKILNQFPNNRASKETVKRVFKAAREMGYDFGNLRNIHRRRADRKKVNLPVLLRIDLQDGNGVFDTGTAILRDLSPYGALLASVHTEKGALPLLPFTLHIELSGPLQGVTIRARTIRFISDEAV